MGEEQKMSVGVCVINRNGIALAADSAGTFSPNKMFYNSVTLADIPRTFGTLRKSMIILPS